MLVWVGAVFVLSSCAWMSRIPQPELMSRRDIQVPEACLDKFAKGRWRFEHAISFSLANGSRGNALGIVLVERQLLQCALTTVEGLTLFEASSHGGTVDVLRALPPFDSPEFAQGLMDDLRALFLHPPGKIVYGRLDNGSPVCRSMHGTEVTDILPQQNGCWELHTYADRYRTRTVTTASCRKQDALMVADHMELTVPGAAGYTLKMRLLRAEHLR